MVPYVCMVSMVSIPSGFWSYGHMAYGIWSYGHMAYGIWSYGHMSKRKGTLTRRSGEVGGFPKQKKFNNISVYADLYGIIYILCWGAHSPTSLQLDNWSINLFLFIRIIRSNSIQSNHWFRSIEAFELRAPCTQDGNTLMLWFDLNDSFEKRFWNSPFQSNDLLHNDVLRWAGGLRT